MFLDKRPHLRLFLRYLAPVLLAILLLMLLKEALHFLWIEEGLGEWGIGRFAHRAQLLLEQGQVEHAPREYVQEVRDNRGHLLVVLEVDHALELVEGYEHALLELLAATVFVSKAVIDFLRDFEGDLVVVLVVRARRGESSFVIMLFESWLEFKVDVLGRELAELVPHLAERFSAIDNFDHIRMKVDWTL